MRITNSMLIDNFLVDMGNSMKKVDKYNKQLITGKQIARISDDPIKLISAMNARQMVNSYSQYRDNLITANTWVDQTETALMDISEALTTIREQIVFANTDTNNPSDRDAVAKLVTGYRDHILQSMNATITSKHIFAGYNTSKEPFVVDETTGRVTYNGLDLYNMNLSDPAVQKELSEKLQLEVGFGMKMDVTFTGVEIVGVGEDNMFKVLDDLIADLESGDGNDNLGKYITKLEKLESNMMEKVVTVGARSVKLEMLEDRYSQDVINYDSIRGQVEDADSAEAIMYMKMAESVYKQALAVGARIIMPTLMDYLR